MHMQIGPFQGSHSDNVRIKVKVKLNLHGIVTVESASLIEGHVDDPVTEPSKMGKMESAAVENVHGHSSADGVSKDKSGRRLEMSVSENIYGETTAAELTNAQEKEHQLAQHDRTIEQIKDKKNNLESYVYETRSKLFNTYRSFATDQEREGISKNLQQTEEWLYGDGDDETENAYASKLQDLKKLVDPIENRYKDGEARAQAKRVLLQLIVEFRTAVEPLSAQEKEFVINECFKAEKWLREKTQLQDSLPKNTDPVLWSTDIRNRTEELKLKCQPAWRKTHPKH